MSGYARVQEHDSDSTHAESLLEEKDDGVSEHQKHKRRFLNREWSLVYMLTLVIILLPLNIYLSTLLYLHSRGPREQGNLQNVPSSETVQTTDQECVRRVSSYTPALEAIEYLDMDFDYAFGKTSEYRGPPTEDREKAWQELWPLGTHEGIMIDAWAIPMLNRTNLEPYKKVKPESGEGYVAWMEVHHQLECLNLVRRYTWFLAGSYSEDRVPDELQASPEINRMHVDYCIETLRLSLMCQGDMTPLLVTKNRNEPSGWRADLNSHHKCRNFTKLQEWAKIRGFKDWETDGEHHYSYVHRG